MLLIIAILLLVLIAVISSEHIRSEIGDFLERVFPLAGYIFWGAVILIAVGLIILGGVWGWNKLCESLHISSQELFLAVRTYIVTFLFIFGIRGLVNYCKKKDQSKFGDAAVQKGCNKIRNFFLNIIFDFFIFCIWAIVFAVIEASLEDKKILGNSFWISFLLYLVGKYAWKFRKSIKSILLGEYRASTGRQ